ncbi:MAG TPA: hypothetical protein VHO23_01515 [Candidatus Paceibacterota bacterium]|nr:hypothetical protein [Candidatus Paceibacterota bacterium]
MPRRPTKKRMKEYVIAAALSLAVIWLLWLIWGIARKEEIARQAVKNTQIELAELKDRKAVLEANMAELATDRGQEATLRQTYNVALPGEEVVIVVPPKKEPEPVVLPWYKKVLGFFGFW